MLNRNRWRKQLIVVVFLLANVFFIFSAKNALADYLLGTFTLSTNYESPWTFAGADLSDFSNAPTLGEVYGTTRAHQDLTVFANDEWDLTKIVISTTSDAGNISFNALTQWNGQTDFFTSGNQSMIYYGSIYYNAAELDFGQWIGSGIADGSNALIVDLFATNNYKGTFTIEFWGEDSSSLSSTPEPATMLIFGIGTLAAGTCTVVRRKRK